MSVLKNVVGFGFLLLGFLSTQILWNAFFKEVAIDEVIHDKGIAYLSLSMVLSVGTLFCFGVYAKKKSQR